MDNVDNIITMPSHTRVVSEDGAKAVFEIDGLYPGYGNTLGNSIRRILLSSMPGAAVTRVKIDGVNHEFSTLEGVMEDMVTILLTIKQLRFKLEGDEPQVATIDVKGAKEVRGKDIKCPTQLEVMNPDHHIATLTSKDSHFIVELTIEAGLGFVPAEELTKDKVAVGELLLDAIFTPIRRVNYEVENMRVGDRTDYNRLRLTIETDGTIAPQKAFLEALNVMRHHLEQVSHFEGAEEFMEEAPSGLAPLKLSARLEKTLLAAGITTPEELATRREDDLLTLEGVGAKAVGDIKKALKKVDLTLAE